MKTKAGDNNAKKESALYRSMHYKLYLTLIPIYIVLAIIFLEIKTRDGILFGIIRTIIILIFIMPVIKFVKGKILRDN